MNVDTLIERMALSDVLSAYAIGVDGRDIERLTACFDERIHVDFDAFAPGMTGTYDGSEWAERIMRGVRGFDATQHVIGNHLYTVDGDQAEGTAEVIASHTIDGERLTVAGRYRHEFVKRDGAWRIRAYWLTPSWIEGSMDLFARAAERGRQSTG